MAQRPKLWDEIPALKDKEPKQTGIPEVNFDENVHYWMLPEDPKQDRIEMAIEIQNAVKNLPKTASTWTVSDKVPAVDWPSNIPTEMIEMAGAWPVPEHFTQSKQRGRNFVNPNYPDGRYFSEVATQCECGAWMIRQERYNDTEVIPFEHDHADDCPKDYRLHARARLAEQRRWTTRRCIYLGHSVRSMQDRLGLSRDSLGEELDALGLPPISDMKEKSRNIRARTWAELLTDHAPEKIARAYDVKGRTVTREVAKRTDYEPRQLYEVRRKND